jgi:transcriptional regulator with XRE-family HTH domain
VDRHKDIQEFLTSRRARLTPEQAGLTSFGDKRRVTGLRREEVAMLAGVSMDYYARLERGHLAGASESVLEAVARALQLDEAERQHLLDLARNSETTMSRRPRRPKPAAAAPRPAVMAILTGMIGIPAYVRTPRMEIVAANELCQALYGGALDDERLPLNLARYVFLDPHSRGFFLDWEVVADDLAGALRVQAGRDPRDRALSDLIGELSTRSY